MKDKITSCFCKLKLKKISIVFTHRITQIFCIIGWLSILSYTNAYYIIYLMMGVAGLLCRNKVLSGHHSISFKGERLNLAVASAFSLLIITANYKIYTTMTNDIITTISKRQATFDGFAKIYSALPLMLSFVCFPIMFLGGMYLTFFILKVITDHLLSFHFQDCRYKMSERRVFLIVFGFISCIHSLVLLLCFYPGVVSIDSLDQLNQIVNNHISNRHPFYHTIFIRPFILAGIRWFGDINIGVAFYSLFSVFFTSAAFSYALVTLYQLHINKKILIATTLIYTLMPYHLIFSFTIWKDIPFSAAVLLFTVSFFRYANNIGSMKKVTIAMIILSGYCMCLFRGNGMIVLFVIILAFAFIYKRKHLVISIACACILVSSIILTYPVLNANHINQSDSIELLSVPLQQISRTVVDNDDLTPEQIEKINKVVDSEKIPLHYNPLSADPMKKLVRLAGNRNYLNSHKAEYALLYFELGISHPYSYFTAWIDQTRGYWNAGYEFWRFGFSCWDNSLHLHRTVVSKPLQNMVYGYIESFEFLDLLKPFVSIGLHTWLLLLIAYIGYRRRDKIAVSLTVPCMAIIFTMLIGTPVFAEFRYAYALFCCLPFLAVVAFRRNEKKDQSEIIDVTKQ